MSSRSTMSLLPIAPLAPDASHMSLPPPATSVGPHVSLVHLASWLRFAAKAATKTVLVQVHGLACPWTLAERTGWVAADEAVVHLGEVNAYDRNDIRRRFAAATRGSCTNLSRCSALSRRACPCANGAFDGSVAGRRSTRQGAGFLDGAMIEVKS